MLILSGAVKGVVDVDVSSGDNGEVMICGKLSFDCRRYSFFQALHTGLPGKS